MGTEVRAVGADFRVLMTKVDTAIGTLNGYFNQLGIDQRSLSGKEVNLTEAISANSAAKSRIMDVDFAKEQSNFVSTTDPTANSDCSFITSKHGSTGCIRVPRTVNGS